MYELNKNEEEDGDLIADLPIDSQQSSTEDIAIIETLLQKHSKVLSNVRGEIQLSVLVGILFVLFSNPIANFAISVAFPGAAASSLILLIVKTVCITLCFWVIVHFYTPLRINQPCKTD